MSRALNFAGGGIHEVAAMRRDNLLIVGHFDCPDAAEVAIANAGGCRAYWSTLNPLATLPTPRVLNPVHLTRGARAGTQHILKRTSLLFDFDPPRPTGSMSTDEEHEAALTQARECRNWLQSLRWPSLPLCDSGSGAHLRAFVDMGTSEESTQLVQSMLRALKRRYSFVDSTAADLPRLCRYYGTTNRKSAENSTERPWRLSRVLDSGESQLVTVEQIASLIALIGVPKPQHFTHTEKPDSVRVERTIDRLAAYLEKIGVALEDIVTLSDGRTLLRLSHCPLNPEHVGSSTGIGISVGGHPQRMCFHNGCGMPWSEWRAAIEKKHGILMTLGGQLIFSPKRRAH